MSNNHRTISNVSKGVMIKNIYILGGHIQALGLARQAKKERLNVTIISNDKWSVARFSKSVDDFVFFADEKRLQSYIKREIISRGDTLLFPTSDDYVEFLSNNYEELKKSFILGIPDPSCTKIFANKRDTYRFCEAYDIAHPMSSYPDNIDDVQKIAEFPGTKYPIVIKPAIMYSFHQQFGKKAFLCDNAKELVVKCSEIEGKNLPINGLVLQEFLSGGSSTLYSYGAFCVNGEPLAWIQANRIRQNPMTFGNSTTFAISCNIPEIESAAKKILKITNYSGLAEVEFMFDTRTNEYKFLEINTRAWKWHTLSRAFGFGFLSEMIRYYNGKDSEFKTSEETKAWVERFTDTAIIIKESLKGKMNPFKAFSTWKISKVSAVWSLKDPLPAIMYLTMSPILFLKRY